MKMLIISLLATLGWSALANPSYGRVCFYEHINYQGQAFCVNAEKQVYNLDGSGWNDKISSILVQGPVAVSIFEHAGYGGNSRRLSQSVADIRQLGNFWNDRISSFVVKRINNNPPTPPPNFGRVCFYEHINFGGASFCLARGQKVSSLVSSNWNDKISSVRVYGDASTYAYQDINYGGRVLWIRQSVSDIRAFGSLWNDFISSMSVMKANGHL